MSNWQDELIELQSRLAYQEDMINQLNDVIARQDGELVLLKQQMVLFAQRLKEIQSNPSGASPEVIDERPPHY